MDRYHPRRGRDKDNDAFETSAIVYPDMFWETLPSEERRLSQLIEHRVNNNENKGYPYCHRAFEEMLQVSGVEMRPPDTFQRCFPGRWLGRAEVLLALQRMLWAFSLGH